MFRKPTVIFVGPLLCLRTKCNVQEHKFVFGKPNFLFGNPLLSLGTNPMLCSEHKQTFSWGTQYYVQEPYGKFRNTNWFLGSQHSLLEPNVILTETQTCVKEEPNFCLGTQCYFQGTLRYTQEYKHVFWNPNVLFGNPMLFSGISSHTLVLGSPMFFLGTYCLCSGTQTFVLEPNFLFGNPMLFSGTFCNVQVHKLVFRNPMFYLRTHFYV